MATSTGQRILVVDDEPLVCDSIRRMLAIDGHRVEMATSAEAAFALSEKEIFDLVITDYKLPVMNGDKLAAAIKARQPNLPIALITAYAESLQSAGAPLPGVDAVISKPFDLHALRETVARLTGERHSGAPAGR